MRCAKRVVTKLELLPVYRWIYTRSRSKWWVAETVSIHGMNVPLILHTYAPSRCQNPMVACFHAGLLYDYVVMTGNVTGEQNFCTFIAGEVVEQETISPTPDYLCILCMSKQNCTRVEKAIAGFFWFPLGVLLRAGEDQKCTSDGAV